MAKKRAKICYLHIGGEKTGSTSIQAFLKANQTLLQDQGVLYPIAPAVPGTAGMPSLAAYAQPDSGVRELLAKVNVSTDYEFATFKKALAADLQKEVANSGCDTLLLSSEHCQSRIENTKKLKVLATLLEGVAEEVRIVFYIRRQDLVATSLYSTALKVGHSDLRPFMPLEGDAGIVFDYWRTCEIYSSVFGKDALDVRLFDDRLLTGGGLIADFCGAVGISDMDAMTLPEQANQSFGKTAQRFLAAFNHDRDQRFGDMAEASRQALISLLSSEFSGAGIKPPQHIAEAFVTRFAEGNEKLRQEFFPEVSASLFGENYSDFPETEEDWMPGVGEALDLGAQLFVKQQAEIERLQRALVKTKKAKK